VTVGLLAAVDAEFVVIKELPLARVVPEKVWAVEEDAATTESVPPPKLSGEAVQILAVGAPG
jgi:hypothetical protein